MVYVGKRDVFENTRQCYFGFFDRNPSASTADCDSNTPQPPPLRQRTVFQTTIEEHEGENDNDGTVSVVIPFKSSMIHDLCIDAPLSVPENSDLFHRLCLKYSDMDLITGAKRDEILIFARQKIFPSLTPSIVRSRDELKTVHGVRYVDDIPKQYDLFIYLEYASSGTTMPFSYSHRAVTAATSSGDRRDMYLYYSATTHTVSPPHVQSVEKWNHLIFSESSENIGGVSDYRQETLQSQMATIAVPSRCLRMEPPPPNTLPSAVVREDISIFRIMESAFDKRTHDIVLPFQIRNSILHDRGDIVYTYAGGIVTVANELSTPLTAVYYPKRGIVVSRRGHDFSFYTGCSEPMILNDAQSYMFSEDTAQLLEDTHHSKSVLLLEVTDGDTGLTDIHKINCND